MNDNEFSEEWMDKTFITTLVSPEVRDGNNNTLFHTAIDKKQPEEQF